MTSSDAQIDDAASERGCEELLDMLQNKLGNADKPRLVDSASDFDSTDVYEGIPEWKTHPNFFRNVRMNFDKPLDINENDVAVTISSMNHGGWTWRLVDVRGNIKSYAASKYAPTIVINSPFMRVFDAKNTFNDGEWNPGTTIKGEVFNAEQKLVCNAGAFSSHPNRTSAEKFRQYYHDPDAHEFVTEFQRKVLRFVLCTVFALGSVTDDLKKFEQDHKDGYSLLEMADRFIATHPVTANKFFNQWADKDATDAMVSQNERDRQRHEMMRGVPGYDGEAPPLLTKEDKVYQDYTNSFVLKRKMWSKVVDKQRHMTLLRDKEYTACPHRRKMLMLPHDKPKGDLSLARGYVQNSLRLYAMDDGDATLIDLNDRALKRNDVVAANFTFSGTLDCKCIMSAKTTPNQVFLVHEYNPGASSTKSSLDDPSVLQAFSSSTVPTFSGFKRGRGDDDSSSKKKARHD